MMMPKERLKLYNDLEKRIGNTLLVQYSGEVPNNNKIWIKRECDNPFGSHYDRVYIALFRHYEEAGKIKPGNKVLETTSGTAGASFTGIGRLLDYQCHVAIPEGVDKAIINVIEENEAVIHYTPEKDYISGFPEFLRKFLPKNKDFSFLNHSMGPRRGPAYTNNEITLSALKEIMKETLNKTSIDYFIPAVGNGSSILGPAKLLDNSKNVIAFESFQSAVAYDQLYPELYEKNFGIKPGTLPRHKLRGTSYQGIDFPHIKNAVNNGIINDVVLVSDNEVDQNYLNLTGRNDTIKMPHWDISYKNYEDLGRTGIAGISVALSLAKKTNNKKMLIIAYDNSDKYDKIKWG